MNGAGKQATGLSAEGQALRKAPRKAEETRSRILEAALAVFRERGFEAATMREVAQRAGMAVGAAYYYFASKEAIVLAFYEEAQGAMRPMLERRLAESTSLEDSVRSILETKFEYFRENRVLLGALAAQMDPKRPVSPFSADTEPIRQQDLSFFADAVARARVKLPKRTAPYLPRLLWTYQMGLLLFWVYDESPGQRRTKVVFRASLRLLMPVLRLVKVPVFRPLHTLAGELLEAIYGE